MSFQTFSAEGINWSISKLFMYEQCPMRFRLKYIDKLPELPLPPDNPLERGNRIHKHLEDFVKGERSSLDGIEAKAIDAFKPMIEHLRTLYSVQQATVEEDWLYDHNWDMTDKRYRCPTHKDHRDLDCEQCQHEMWLWVKLDWSVLDEEKLTVITGDWKSGKSKYKAVDHIQQTQLYAAVSAIKYPWADTHIAEIPYVDEGHIRSSTYTREEALRFVDRFQKRADKIYADRLFRANANVITCKWCPYRKNGGTGACPVAAV